MLLYFMLHLFLFPYYMGTLKGSTLSATNNIGKPGCLTMCGNLSVPYPFGIGKDTGCSLDDSFSVICNTSYSEPKLFLLSSGIEIYNISDSEFRIATDVAYKCYNEDKTLSWDLDMNYTISPFSFSPKNKFIVIGCDDFSMIRGEGFSGGCVGLCSQARHGPGGQCLGMGCCETSIPKGLDYYNVTLYTFRNHSDVWSFNTCGYAFLGEEGSFKFQGASDLTDEWSVWERILSTVPVVVDWVVAGNCSECKGNSSCVEVADVDGGGYRCKCNNGYEGNPYLHPGCQDINECEDLETNPCYGDCMNTLGGYTCSCPLGSFGDAKAVNGCQHAKDSQFSSTIYIIGAMLGLLAILSVIVGIFFGIRRRKLMNLREKFFEQNGGVLLKQKINSQGSHEAMTLFSTHQLRKATDNYSQENIIGRGGYGVVYKGVLSDKHVVAIKKSKIVDGSQAEQFINEVLILTQVIHRNVVKLLGCCLEEEVPILVYEFISNNTLFHHIHSRLGGMNWLSWENRLRIAVEAAGAIAYLHSETIMPIIHRDVKSTNILLDDNYIAKISDFGASRLVPIDHEQVTTLIQGTLGYLDPEYFNTSQLTEKSDVYSFGVVLAELITGKKPIGVDRANVEKNLATYFVNAVKENRLFEIVEPRILREGTFGQIQAVGDLIKRCLSSKGQDRPTMKKVAVELDNLRKFTTHQWIQQHKHQETKSLVLEVEQSDLYDVPLVSYGNNDSESY
ncbi:wall-associated receptor kinase 5 isoform X1 [Helianthus annuus]|uniref:wall-associated receptor kinase 5 isoform X1 n=1 Tax=Helianthus annuus TaxID=4232 RepID=UPI000B90874A|nr:wall-associated receptor kinase 5 isoform X1 [Helianthus annuus]